MYGLLSSFIAGRTGQEFNDRTHRRGAFWEDRYHATAIESGEQLARCVVSVDLNMVRAGVVTHPAQWKTCGYHEIQQPRRRWGIIDREALAEVLEVEVGKLAERHAEWIAAAVARGGQGRVREWSSRLAVGSRGFVAGLQAKAHCGVAPTVARWSASQQMRAASCCANRRRSTSPPFCHPKAPRRPE